VADPTSHLKARIAVVVTVVWAISFLADIVPALNYEPSPYIHLAFMLVLGGLFGASFVGRGDGK
jgi:hypothetical protein